MNTELPLVSVITVCLNSGKTIRKTIESVIEQTYTRIQYIIVDGGSTDDTLDIVNEYRNHISVLISEKDEGISDAFNKGIKAAEGEYIQILNADDRLEKHKIERSVKILEKQHISGFIFGDIIREKPDGSTVIVKGDKDYHLSIQYTMPRMNHPTVLARKKLFDLYGGFHTQWKIAMDYDWLLRIHKEGVIGMYSDTIQVYMSEGGLSQTHAYKAFQEVRDISVIFGFNKINAYSYYYTRCLKHFILVSLGVR